MSAEICLYLTQLDPVTTALDLGIATSEEVPYPFVVPGGQVTSSVGDDLGSIRVWRRRTSAVCSGSSK